MDDTALSTPATAVAAAGTGKTWTSIQRVRVQAQPVTADHDVVPVKNPDGEIEILAIGSDGAINWIRRDPESESGWLLKTVPGASALALGGVTDFASSLGNTVFGVLKNPERVATFARLEYSAQHDTLTPNFVSGPIVANPPVVGIDDFSILHDDRSPLLFQLSATVKRNGSVPLLSCLVQSAPGVVSNRPLWLWKIDRATHAGGLLTARKAPAIFNSHQSGISNIHAAIIGGVLTPLYDDHVHQGRYYDDLDVDVDNNQFPPLAAKTFAVLDHPDDYPELFAIDSDNRLRHIASKGIIGSHFPTWDASWTEVPLATPLGESPTLIHVEAIRLYDGGPIHVFGIDTQNFLWVIAQNDALAWQPPANLGLKAARVAPSFAGSDPRDPAAHRVVVTAPNGALTLLSRTEGGDWLQEPINIENPNASVFQTVASFIGQVTVTGANGLPVSVATVSLGASDEGVYKVNGNLVLLSDQSTTQVQADGRGRVTVETLLDDQLGAPTLSFESAQLPGWIELRPNQRVQDLFATITADGLRNATNPDTGEKVLPADADFDTLATSLNEAMKNAAALDDFRCGAAKPRSADGDAKPWRVQFDGRAIVFDRIEPDAFEAIWNTAVDPSASRDGLREVGGFLGVDWGDLWEGFRNGVVKVVGVSIDKLGRALVKIGDTVYRFVLETARQVFDFALALLDLAGAVLGHIIGWLLKYLDAYDDWPTILKNRDYIKRMVTSTILREAGRIPDLNSYQPAIDNFFDTIKGQVDNSFDAINQALGIQNREIQTAVAGRYDWSEVPDLRGTDPLAALQAIEWLVAKLIEAIQDVLNVHVPTPSAPNLTAAVKTTIKNVEGEIVTDAEKLFSRIAKEVEGWINDPGSFQASVIAALVRDVAEPVIDDAITLGKHLTKDALDIGNAAVKDVAGLVDWMDDEIRLPFFSEFYSSVLDEVGGRAGNKLSFLDIVALMDAIVVTRVLGDISRPVDLGAAAGDDDSAFDVALVASIIAGVHAALGAAFESAIMTIDYAEKGEDAFTPKAQAGFAVILELAGICAAIFGYAAAGKEPADKPMVANIIFWTVYILARLGNILLAAVTFAATKIENPQTWVKVALRALPAAVAYFAGLGLLAYAITLAVQIDQNKQDGEKAAAILVDVMLFLGWISLWMRTSRPLISLAIKGTHPLIAAAVISGYTGGRFLLGVTSAGLNATAVYLNTRGAEVDADAAAP